MHFAEFKESFFLEFVKGKNGIIQQNSECIQNKKIEKCLLKNPEIL